jgi:hypothetical protein
LHRREFILSKNELLLLADEHFSGFTVQLALNPDDSRLYSDRGQDVTDEYFAFINMLLRLNGVPPSSH